MGFAHPLRCIGTLDMRDCRVELLGVSLECFDTNLFEVDRKRVKFFKNTHLTTLDRKGSLGLAVLKHNTPAPRLADNTRPKDGASACQVLECCVVNRFGGHYLAFCR